MKPEGRQERLKSAYAAAQQRLMRVLHQEDPDGMGSSVGAPQNEYSQAAARLLTSLRDATTNEQARSATTAMYPDASDGLVNRVIDVWREFTANTAPDKQFRVAPRGQSERARTAIDRLIAAAVPVEERPYLVTDQATIFDITTLDETEIAERCMREYGSRPSRQELGYPLWHLAELLASRSKPR